VKGFNGPMKACFGASVVPDSLLCLHLLRDPDDHSLAASQQEGAFCEMLDTVRQRPGSLVILATMLTQSSAEVQPLSDARGLRKLFALVTHNHTIRHCNTIIDRKDAVFHSESEALVSFGSFGSWPGCRLLRLPGDGFAAHPFAEKIGRNGCEAPAYKPHNTGLRSLVLHSRRVLFRG
jgi:hypothetical protein